MTSSSTAVKICLRDTSRYQHASAALRFKYSAPCLRRAGPISSGANVTGTYRRRTPAHSAAIRACFEPGTQPDPHRPKGGREPMRNDPICNRPAPRQTARAPDPPLRYSPLLNRQSGQHARPIDRLEYLGLPAQSSDPCNHRAPQSASSRDPPRARPPSRRVRSHRERSGAKGPSLGGELVSGMWHVGSLLRDRPNVDVEAVLPFMGCDLGPDGGVLAAECDGTNVRVRGSGKGKERKRFGLSISHEVRPFSCLEFIMQNINNFK